MIRRFVLGLCLLLAAPVQATAIRLVDDAGRTLELPQPPQRIISLTPHLTELLFAVGAGAQIAGVDSASDYPAAARTLPRVGDYSRIHFERILALQPDLIVVWVGGNRPVDIHALQQLGFPVLHTHATRLDDVARLLRLLGQASGHAAAGESAAAAYSARLARVRGRAGQPPLRVFYQVWDRPLMTVGGTHWISDALTRCGAHNVFADLQALAPTVSREAVLGRAPELIVGSSDARDLRHAWLPFSHLPAVKNKAFVQVDADRLHRLTPRLVEGVMELCAAVDAYR
ncbi:MAG: cobalamin-binding protein [Thiobacillus sp.]|uniref:cobalamin-binding protein n=1 Tax=Thiobacillus sp. TaxID=924 RepID=UPI00273629B0|nr:cobalamin-binding protein [Thiobacillus sp.]MDP3584334.1 cobalamin-binding protein [Thiobacillus sp.]